MTEEEAREVLRKHMEEPYKDHEWPKVWIGEKISEDKTGFSFQATLYGPNENPEDGFQNWGVDARTKECMFAIM